MASGTKTKGKRTKGKPAPRPAVGCYARTQAELAWVFGISIQAIRKDVENGAPARGDAGYNLRDWVAWRHKGGADDESARLALRKKRAEVRRLELEVERREGTLLHARDVEEQFGQFGRIVMAIFAAAGPALSRKLVGKSPTQVGRIVTAHFDAAGRKAAADLARTRNSGRTRKAKHR